MTTHAYGCLASNGAAFTGEDLFVKYPYNVRPMFAAIITRKIKQADFPAEAPKSSSHKYEAANAEHSVHDLSSECSKE